MLYCECKKGVSKMTVTIKFRFQTVVIFDVKHTTTYGSMYEVVCENKSHLYPIRNILWIVEEKV
jgi:hypothetical protein